jgi:hypothetical protein
MHDGSHSHSGGSSGAHTHGSGSSSSGGVLVAILLIVAFVAGSVTIAVHIIGDREKLRHDSVLTPEDMRIRAAKLAIACREIEELNGADVVGPPCSADVKSAMFAIQLLGVPPGVKFTSSGTRGTYGASCTLIAGGDAETGSVGTIVTSPSRQGTFLSSPQGVLLPSNTCAVSTTEPVQAVEIDISRASISDNGDAYSIPIREFIANIDQSWYSSDGTVYSP